jgi:hypothetical protein
VKDLVPQPGQVVHTHLVLLTWDGHTQLYSG